MRAFFSPETLHAGAVKGLTGNRVETPGTRVANFRYAFRIIITAGCIQSGSSCGFVLSEVCGAHSNDWETLSKYCVEAI